jgi:limonene-1,2-epoxide hydrolase
LDGADGLEDTMREDDSAPQAAMRRLQDAMNARDTEAFVACFDHNYDSAQPAHPARTFTGSEQVRKNWSSIFESIPDFHAEILATAVDLDHCWTEWRWTGTQTDGGIFEWCGVTVMQIQDGRIVAGRLYMEPVEREGQDIDATVSEMTASVLSAEDIDDAEGR